MIKIYEEFTFEDLQDRAWSGAVDTLAKIEEHDKTEEFMQLLSDIYCDNIPSITEINDLLWFEEDYIFGELGIE